jgi:hypothetical protein
VKTKKITPCVLELQVFIKNYFTGHFWPPDFRRKIAEHIVYGSLIQIETKVDYSDVLNISYNQRISGHIKFISEIKPYVK